MGGSVAKIDNQKNQIIFNILGLNNSNTALEENAQNVKNDHFDSFKNPMQYH